MIRKLLPVAVRVWVRRALAPVFRRSVYREREWRAEFFAKAMTALAFNGIEGDYAEFGCCGAMTFALAYREMRRHKDCPRMLWAFDSFAGLPESVSVGDHHPNWREGAMRMSEVQFRQACWAQGVPARAYKVVSGFYSETLVPTSGVAPQIALAFVDCDLYSSTKAVLEFIRPRLVPGMIIAFDDYYCWSRRQISGEQLALREFLETNRQWSFHPYLQFGWGGMSFYVHRRLAEAQFA